MQLSLPENARKGDVIAMIGEARRGLSRAKATHYRDPLVSKESWERDSSARIFFHKSKIPALQAAGVMKKSEEFDYGYILSNKHITSMNSDLRAIEALLGEISAFLDGYTLRPKYRHYSEFEISRFTVIEGGYSDSRLIGLLGGVANA